MSRSRIWCDIWIINLRSHSFSPVLPAIDTEVLPQLEAMKQPMQIEEIDLSNLAPRKPDWDLKRDINKKLEKLERRTQRAIAELIRERLKEGQTDSLLASVNVATANVEVADKYRDQD